MARFKKFVLFKKRNRLKKIILSSVIAIAMASFYMIGISANEVVYLNYDFDPFQFSQNSNTKASYGYSDNTDMYLSPFSNSSSSTSYITSLPYRSSGYFDFDFGSVYFDGVVYNSQGLSVDNRFLVTFDLGFSYYFDEFSIDLYFLVDSSSVSFDGFYLDEGNNIVSLDISSDRLFSGSFSNIDSSYISSNYIFYLDNYKYFKNSSGANSLVFFTSYNSFSLYKLTIYKSNLNKELIRNFTLNIHYNYPDYPINDGPRVCPYFYFGHQIVNGFIKSSQDQVYTQQLALAQQQNQMLEDIIGDVPSDMQNDLNTDQAAQDQKLEELNDNLDIINEPTMPPEEQLPTAPIDDEDFEEVSQDIESVFNLDILNLFNILVPTGCVGFLVYTVMRRF